MKATNTELLLWLDSLPEGATKSEIALHINRQEDATSHRLGRLKKDGHCVIAGPPQSKLCRWSVPRHADTALAAYQREVAAAQAISRRAREVRKKAAKKARVESDVTFEAPIVKRIVKAVDAAPLRKPCAASVWELAS